MQLHHDKHHAAYVSNLNAALKDHADLQAKPLPELLAHLSDAPEDIRTAVRNNAGGHANHTMFWQVMGGKGGAPDGDLAAAIARDLCAASRSCVRTSTRRPCAWSAPAGRWCWSIRRASFRAGLAAEPGSASDGRQESALFGNDVWEHAYYLKYHEFAAPNISRLGGAC